MSACIVQRHSSRSFDYDSPHSTRRISLLKENNLDTSQNNTETNSPPRIFTKISRSESVYLGPFLSFSLPRALITIKAELNIAVKSQSFASGLYKYLDMVITVLD